MDEREARLILCCAVEPGTPAITQLVAEHGAIGVADALRSPASRSRWAPRARQVDVAAVVARAASLGVRFVIPGDVDWPSQLEALGTADQVQGFGGPPFGLWLRGSASLASAERGVAIVGSRAATPYGETIATELAAGLGLRGVSVISGGAYGIDAAAHRGCLATDSPTFAVMAAGLDTPYPRGNSALLHRASTQGALIGELPPGEHPTRARFLTRNRLIAALASVTVIVEAGARSGARNTVSWAVACGRPVLAVPGPVTSAGSATPHRLIREAEAVLCRGVDDVLELLGPIHVGPAPPRAEHRWFDDLTGDERAVYEVLPVRGWMTAGEVALRSGTSLGTCLGVLDRLVDLGHVSGGIDGWRAARVPQLESAETGH